MASERPTLLERIEPTLGDDEAEYRRHFFATDLTQARISSVIVLILVSVVLVLDLTRVPGADGAAVLAVRALFFLITFGVFVSVRRHPAPSSLDRASLIFACAFAVQFIVLLDLRPPSRVDDIALFVLTLACYALSPAPILYRTAAPVLLAIGSLIELGMIRAVNAPVTLWPTVIVLIATNVLGFWGSARLHTQRRRQYQSEERLRESLVERDALIDRLRQSHKLESMGRIVGGVAHDFNNILASMLASVEFLSTELPVNSGSLPDVETLRASVMRGADLTKQLLAFSRQQVLEPKIVSLNDLVADVEHMLKRTLGGHITITLTLEEHLPSVRVDPVQFQQILLNLIVNARDAMPVGGTLLIHTHADMLTTSTMMAHSVAPPGLYVTLTVSDSGTGIDALTLEKIFEPFFTTKPKGRGTGLGLSTVFGIVEQSGGHIRVASAIGRGTTFDILFPAVAERPAVVAPESTPQTNSRGTETILLAEDDEALRPLLARALTKHGYRVLQAANGAEALRVAERHDGPVHLLASDIVMPEMGGQVLARELTAKRPEVRVLLMSGYTADAFPSGELQAGDAFLQKPVDMKVLIRRVRSLLDGEEIAVDVA